MTVPLDVDFGHPSAVATVGGYNVTFSMLDGARKYLAEVRRGDTLLWAASSTAVSVSGHPSAAMPEGQMDYFCAPTQPTTVP